MGMHGRTSSRQVLAEVLAAFAAGDDCSGPPQPPRRRALAPTEQHRPAVHHPAQRRSPLLPQHPLPRSGSWTLPVLLGKRKQQHCRIAHGAAVHPQCGAGGRGGLTEPSRCQGFATYESHEGERPMAWGNLCGGWSGKSRRRGCQAVAWHKWRWRFEGGMQHLPAPVRLRSLNPGPWN
jgi:hypothetical protein